MVIWKRVYAGFPSCRNPPNLRKIMIGTMKPSPRGVGCTDRDSKPVSIAWITGDGSHTIAKSYTTAGPRARETVNRQSTQRKSHILLSMVFYTRNWIIPRYVDWKLDFGPTDSKMRNVTVEPMQLQYSWPILFRLTLKQWFWLIRLNQWRRY